MTALTKKAAIVTGASSFPRYSYKAYYSSVLDRPADEVWDLVRDFNNYPLYIEGVTESAIEDGRRGDEVGAVRRFLYGGTWIRQRLTVHCDAERSFTYAGMDKFNFPVKEGADTLAPIDYQGTLRLTPIINWRSRVRGMVRRIRMLARPGWTMDRTSLGAHRAMGGFPAAHGRGLALKMKTTPRMLRGARIRLIASIWSG